MGQQAKKSESNASPSKKKNQEAQVVAIAPKVREHYRTQFNELLHDVTSYSKNPDLGFLRKAYTFAYQAHKNQLRKSGAPYIEHPLATAQTLSGMRMDPVTVAAGLLHDVVEDTGITVDEVKEIFGDEIAQLVDGVTKISELKFQSHAEKQAENFRKMIFSMAQDLRVIIIKLADRLHNMRTLDYLPKRKAARIALETQEVYTPLAHRFGMARIKWELEDLSLKALQPREYNDLVKLVAAKREEREDYINRIVNPLNAELQKHHIDANIFGRAKTLSSIYHKMLKRNKPFEEIYDLLAIRIIVKKIDECYFALGIVHTLFTPVHDRFKDYIATPKLNLYQSLHTTVVGPEGRMVEIQVRTEEMHRIAEMGIAAHWKYKEGKQSEDELDRYSAWVREMIDWQKDTLDPEEYLDILKTDLFTAEVFVFSPKGDLYKLPIGSTSVDFAFAVHSDVGMHCIGAKVNGKIVALNTPLKSGDAIEIITSANQRPNQDWLTFVKTSKAKSRIKRWIKETQTAEAVKLGEEILSKGLKRYRIKLPKNQIKTLVNQLKYPNVRKFYAALGRGEISFQKIIELLAPEKLESTASEKKDNLFERFVDRARGSAHGVRVQGVDNLLIRFAKCCHPVPGDPILGFISKGRGIVVHRRDCSNAMRLMESPEKNIEVSWDVDGKDAFMVQLQVLSSGRKDFLKDIGDMASSMDTTILKVDMNTENSLITAFLILEVRDLSHLNRIIRRLYRLKGTLSVERGDQVNRSR